MIESLFSQKKRNKISHVLVTVNKQLAKFILLLPSNKDVICVLQIRSLDTSIPPQFSPTVGHQSRFCGLHSN